MTWEQRGEKRYYYRDAWRNGRATRTYLGTGSIGEMAATADALQRVQRERQARQWRHQQERLLAAEGLLQQLCQQSDLLVRAALLVAGYHRHDRGAWRLKRATRAAN